MFDVAKEGRPRRIGGSLGSLLVLCAWAAACGDESPGSAPDPDGSGGAAMGASGGSAPTGGAAVPTGGAAVPTGGATTGGSATGGAAAPTGGATMGGTAAPTGGATMGGAGMATGGATMGGAGMATGGVAAGTGSHIGGNGATNTGSDGAATGTGGEIAGMGGELVGTGGAIGGSGSTGGGTGGSVVGGGDAGGNGGARAGTGRDGGSGAASAGNGGAAGGTGEAAGTSGVAGGDVGASGTAGAGGGPAYSPCPTSPSDPCAVLPLGDSITEGFGSSGGGYRVELFRLAMQNDKNITFVGSLMNGPTNVEGRTFPRQHEGHGGYTIDSDMGHSGISGSITDGALEQYHPHIVLLMIGTNDINGNVDVAGAPTRLGNLIDDITTRAPDTLVVVATIMPIDNAGTDQRVQAYNAALPDLVNERAADGKHVVLLDNYAAIAQDPNFRTSLLADYLHPNDAGYAVLGASFYGAIAEYL